MLYSPRTQRFAVLGFAIFITTTVVQATHAKGDIPPPSEWIKVDTVPEEYDYIKKYYAAIGEAYEVLKQSAFTHEGKHLDRIETKSKKTGTQKDFFFDTTLIFENMEFAFSATEKSAAYEKLNKKYPNITPDLLPKLKALLKHDNIHCRTWSATALGKIKTTESCELVVKYLQSTSVFHDFEVHMACEASAQKLGEQIVKIIGKRLPTLTQQQRWDMIDVLGDINAPNTYTVIEKEIRTGPAKNHRMCFLSLGKLRCKESVPLLLEHLAKAGDSPDDALVWALGKCGNSAHYETILSFTNHQDEKVRLSAIVALGYLGDKRAIPQLLKFAKEGKDHNTRVNAMFSLGNLKAVDSVPYLLEQVYERGDTSCIVGLTGIYNDDYFCMVTKDGYIEVCLVALSIIGDKRAISVCKELLFDEKYYLFEDDIADAAARAGWREMVPDLIKRFQTSGPYWSRYKTDSGEIRERISPALRKLTGQSFGEDPKAWIQWWEKNKATWKP